MKKVLIISYFFPPLGWSGVQRTLKFVKFLRNFDWEPIVVTVDNSDFSIKDDSLIKDIPNNLKILRIEELSLKTYTDNIKNQLLEFISSQFKILEKDFINIYASSIESNFRHIRNILSIPDNKNLWTYNVLKTISLKLNFKDIDLIYTTSGPYSAHIIGYNLKQKYDIPWVADFRDEWTNNPYFNPNTENMVFKLQKDLETKILRYCDKVITTSQLSTLNYINNFSLQKSKVKTITNGYDDEDFIDIPLSCKNNKFTIVYTGSLYLIRTPYTFLSSINNLLKKSLLDKDKIQINFIGTCEQEIYNKITELDIYKTTKFIPYLPHLDSIAEASKADLLLLIPNSKAICPGKTFEYLRLKTPILALSPKDSVVEDILNKTGCGKNIDFDDIESIENYIKYQYDNWLNSVNTLNVNEEEIKKYKRKYLTGILSKVFDEIISIKNHIKGSDSID